MKKTYLWALAALVMTACSSDEDITTLPVQEGQPTIDITLEKLQSQDITTRAFVDEDGKVSWEIGDVIKLKDYGGSNTYKEFSNVGGTKFTTIIEGDDVPAFTETMAYYAPEGITEVNSNGFVMPKERDVNDNYLPLVGKLVPNAYTYNHTEMKHVFGVLRAKVKVPANTSKIVVTADKALSGSFAFVDDDAENAIATPASGAGINEIIYNVPDAVSEVDLLIPLLSGKTYSQIKLETVGKTTAGYVATTKKATNVTVARGKIYTPTGGVIDLRPNVDNAKIMYVDNNGDLQESTNLTTAVTAAVTAQPENPVVLLGEGEFYTGDLEIASGKEVTIQAGAGTNPEDVVLSGKITTNGGKATLSGVTIQQPATASHGNAPLCINENSTVTIDNCVVKTAKGTTNDERTIDIEGNTNVVIKNSTIACDDNGGAYKRTINITGNNANIEISNCTITSGEYPFNIVSNSTNNTIKVEDSTVQGWCIVNVWTNGNTFEFKNCDLTSTNDKSLSDWNSFYALMLNSGVGNTTITLEDCNVTVTSNTGNKQGFVCTSGVGNVLNILGNTSITGTNVNGGNFYTLYNSYDNVIEWYVDDTATAIWEGENLFE